MELFIKNMVCARCIKSVTGIFHSVGAVIKKIELGKIELDKTLPEDKMNAVRELLDVEGFEMLDDKRVKLIEEIKRMIIELVHYKELDEMNENLSGYLSRQLNKDYNYLSNLFSSIESTTIEQYFILQKIEKVKEWLVYDELTVNEMAFKLGYSSVAHLSNQFKKITGFTPVQFKKLKEHNRKKLEDI